MSDIDRERIQRIKDREDEVFVAARPCSAGLWAQAKASMPNGVPMSWLRTSYDHPPLFVAEGKGAHFRDADALVLDDVPQLDPCGRPCDGDEASVAEDEVLEILAASTIHGGPRACIYRAEDATFVADDHPGPVPVGGSPESLVGLQILD